MNDASDREGLTGSNLNRRDFLRLMGLLTGVGLAPSALISCGPQSTPKPAASGTPTPLPTVANPGERIPELNVTFFSGVSWMMDMWRKLSLDGEKLGLKYKINAVSNAAYTNSYVQQTYGDLLHHENASNTYRDSDPTEQVVARVHSREKEPPKRNAGRYQNPEVDRLAELVETELDHKKRLEAAYQIQDILAKDYFFWAACTGPMPICAYNSADWEGVMPSAGGSVGATGYPWNWVSVRSKTGRKRLVHATADLSVLTLTNPFTHNGVRGTNSLYWDRFLMLDADLKLVPWVIASWKSLDSLTWEVKIRDGMKWHDGRPATAEDVVFTFNLMTKWKPSYYSVVWQSITSAEVVDKVTVRLKTKLPAANMTTDLLVRSAFVPKHIWENLGERQNAATLEAVKMEKDLIIGTGPFKFEHISPDVELLLSANKDHWMPPKFEEFLQMVVPNLDSVLGKMEGKEVDFEDAFLTPTQANRLKAQKHISIVEGTRALNPFIVQFFDRLPWRDPVFRRAWARTVDKDYMVNVVWEGAGKAYPYSTLMAEKHPFHNKDIKERFSYDLDEARKLLAEGGYSWDKEGRLLYPSADNADYKKRVERALA